MKWVDTQGGLATILLLPAIVIVMAIVGIPVFYAIYLSLHRIYLIFPEKNAFIGVKNYIEAFHSPHLWNALGRTAYYVAGVTIVGIILALGIALVLNMRFRGRAFVRNIVLLPWALAYVINAIMWKWILNSRYGALNGILYSLGLIHNYQHWLQRPLIAMNFIIMAKIWKELPFMILFILAGLQILPKELYEAAEVDGANSWQRFRRITLPLIAPILMILAIMETIWGFMVFDIIYVVTGGGPANTTQVISYYTYTESFKRMHLGMGATIAIIQTLIVLILTIFYIRRLTRRGAEF